MSTHVVYLAICLQALLVQNTFGQLLNSGVSRNGLGLEVDAKAFSRGTAGISGYGLSNVGLTNLGGRGLGLNNVGAKSIGLNNLGARGIGLNNLDARRIGFNNIAATGVRRNSINLSNRDISNRLNNAASFGGSKYGVGVPDVAAVSGVPVTGPFVSNGEAEVAVGGEFLASGTTLVAGQVPVIGAAGFSGVIPARGVVSIAGECGCSRIPL